MKHAPTTTLFALFDAVMRIEGADVVIFERHQPDAPAALRAWCEAHGFSITDHKHTTYDPKRTPPNQLIHTLRVSVDHFTKITVHFNDTEKTEAA